MQSTAVFMRRNYDHLRVRKALGVEYFRVLKSHGAWIFHQLESDNTHHSPFKIAARCPSAYSPTSALSYLETRTEKATTGRVLSVSHVCVTRVDGVIMYIFVLRILVRVTAVMMCT